jgi:hypothetical protein
MKTTTKNHHKIDIIIFSMGRNNKTHAFDLTGGKGG